MWGEVMGDISKYFNRSEMLCRCGCGLYATKPELLKKLDELREAVKMPLIVTSGCRCNAHNRAVGGVDTSDHLDGIACDVRCEDMKLLLRAALKMFPRVGIGAKRSFIHVDINTKKPAYYWTYDNNYKRLT
jgi:uncharacterized protein YcbK (DUF882 family)